MATNLEIFEMNWDNDPTQLNYEDKQQIAIYKDQLVELTATNDLLLEKKGIVTQYIDRINEGELDPILQEEKDDYLADLTAKETSLASEIEANAITMNTLSDNILKLEIKIILE